MKTLAKLKSNECSREELLLEIGLEANIEVGQGLIEEVEVCLKKGDSSLDGISPFYWLGRAGASRRVLEPLMKKRDVPYSANIAVEIHKMLVIKEIEKKNETSKRKSKSSK